MGEKIRFNHFHPVFVAFQMYCFHFWGKTFFHVALMNITFQYIWTESTLTELILLSFFLLVFVIRLVFVFLFSGRILFIRNKKKGAGIKYPVSIVISFRNEEQNIKQNLPGLLQLENTPYEVVAVDDFSQDNSYSVLGTLHKDFKNLRLSFINQETRFSEKIARNLGFKAARNDWIILVPVSISRYSPDWLARVSQSFAPDCKMVVNYSNLQAESRFFNLLYRIERFYQQQKSFGYTLNGLSLVYSEENIGFHKTLYFDAGGFGKVLNEPYANMELLFNLHGRKKHTRLNFSAETAIRYSETVRKTEFLELLKKSFRIEKYLGLKKRLVLWLDRWSNLLFFPLLIIVFLLFVDIWPVIAGVVFIPFLAYLFIIKIIQNRLKEPKIFLSSLLYQLVMQYFKEIYRFYFYRKSKKNKWKHKS